MIRFILGLILVMGSVGAIDADAAILPAMVVAGAGFALMLWSLNSFTSAFLQKTEDYNVLRS